MERRLIKVRGLVQGVGFRPFVYHLAGRLNLTGFVKNQTGSVHIEVEGETPCMEEFLADLVAKAPALARVEEVKWEALAPFGDLRFRIESSEDESEGQVFISPDVATCKECLAEMLDPGDRRFGYPFLNCTNCGPRLTIIKGSPYDRQNTTMASFVMCDSCRKEYDDPTDRRFHAQPTACPQCGPRLSVLDSAGRPISSDDPLAFFASALREGKIGAVKGLGGYHLACLAQDNSSVSELRRRKHRDEKPFAVMVPDIKAVEALVEAGTAELSLLNSPGCPIVLLRKRSHCAIAEEVAPGNPWLGLMLPYTPLHHLLLRSLEGAPVVMTSGNRSDEPIAFHDDATEKLAGIADLFLVHDRKIHVRCDDSVTRVVDGIELPSRRSRGYAPWPIALPFSCNRPILAVGGQLKATFALGRDRKAFLSHHMGDLDHLDAYRAFEQDVKLYQELFELKPECLAHDLHPDYATTRYAERAGIPLIAVQHHHAHMASCMAENGLDEPVIGVAFDGTGFGSDGAVWGGEFLLGDYRGYRRGAYLRYVGMPGGDRAIREPWRMAVAHLRDSQAELKLFEERHSHASIHLLLQMLDKRIKTPLTSSAGRLFDAVAAIMGVRDRVSYEGQAAVELEWLASGETPDRAYPFELILPMQGEGAEAPLVIDTRPLIRAVAEEVAGSIPPPIISRRFHSTLVDMIAAVCGRLRQKSGISLVVLSGGVFLNALLTSEVNSRLAGDGFRVYRHRLVPPNDGGLCLGQLAVAAASLG